MALGQNVAPVKVNKNLKFYDSMSKGKKVMTNNVKMCSNHCEKCL